MQRMNFDLMTLSILLVMIGICFIPGGRSQVLLDGSCPPIPVHRNFLPEKFLGTWYQVEKYYTDDEVNTKCNKMDFTSGHDGRINVLRAAIKEKQAIGAFLGSGMPKISYGLANFEHGDPGRMTISIGPTSSPSIGGENSPIIKPFDFWVLDTDYDSYALVYSCQDICRGRQHTKRIWILGRTALIPESLLNRLYDRLRILGLDPKRLTHVDQSQCVNVAVSVRSSDHKISHLHPNAINSFDRNSARKFLASLTSQVRGRKKSTYIKTLSE